MANLEVNPLVCNPRGVLQMNHSIKERLVPLKARKCNGM